MSVLRNINYLLDVTKGPCAEPELLLMVKVAFITGPPALLQLFVPGCSEIVQARLGTTPLGKGFEPLTKGAADGLSPSRRGRHGKKIDATIQRAYPGTPQGGRQFLYRIGITHIQRLLWWWLVADVTTEFFATWTSLIYEEQGCALPEGPYYARPIPPIIYGAIPQQMLMVPELKAPYFAVTTGEIHVFPGTTVSIIYSTSWRGWPDAQGQGGTANVSLVELDPIVVIATGHTNEPGEGNGMTVGGSYKYRGQHTVTTKRFAILIECEPAQVGMELYRGQLTVSSTGFPHSSAFGCKPPSVDFGEIFGG
jgi:hypothetical protein